MDCHVVPFIYFNFFFLKKRKYPCKTVTNFPFYFHFINSDPLSKIPQLCMNKPPTMLFSATKYYLLKELKRLFQAKFYCIRILTQNNLYHKTKFSRTVKYKSPIFFYIIPLNNNPKFNYEQLLPELIINV